jgi:hypothetical protein
MTIGRTLILALIGTMALLGSAQPATANASEPSRGEVKATAMDRTADGNRTGSLANAKPSKIATAPDGATIQAWPWYCHILAEYPYKSGDRVYFRGHLNCGDDSGGKLFTRADLTVMAYRNGSLITHATSTCTNDYYCFGELSLQDQPGSQCYVNLVSVWVWTWTGEVGLREKKAPASGCVYY